MSNLLPSEPSKLIKNIHKVKAKKISFEINKVLLPIGVEGTFGMIKHPGASLAVPITSDGNIIILRQYRFAVARRILEFPAGTLEEGEEPLISMQRELGEETGYSASTWDSLGLLLPCPGYSDEIIHLYLARDLSILDRQPKGDLDEDIEVLELSKLEFEKLISSGEEALDAKTITAWHRAYQFLNMNN